MKMYVVSTQYQPLVTVNLKTPSLWGNKPVQKKSVSKQDLEATFNKSKNQALIACTNPEGAIAIMTCLLKDHNTTPEFIEQEVCLFASPVVYTVEIDRVENLAAKLQPVTVEDLFDYANPAAIPLSAHGPYEVTEHRIASAKSIMADKFKSMLYDLMAKRVFIPNICKLPGLKWQNVQEATYIGADGSIEKVNLQQDSDSKLGFFARLLSFASADEGAAQAPRQP
ncbi:MAG: hypothetical protein ACHP65_09655 [Legionellales bacterium]